MELTALHAAMLGLATRRRWVLVSWMLSITHLGMLGPRQRVGLPNAITLLRANLPAIGRGGHGDHGDHYAHLLGAAALASDLVVGRLARTTGTETRFGTYADAVADATFWTSFAMRHDPARSAQVAAVAAWVLPIAVITVLSVHQGRMIDHPRPVLLRPAAAMQAVLAVRALRRRVRPAARDGVGPTQPGVRR